VCVCFLMRGLRDLPNLQKTMESLEKLKNIKTLLFMIDHYFLSCFHIFFLDISRNLLELSRKFLANSGNFLDIYRKFVEFLIFRAILAWIYVEVVVAVQS